MKLKKLITGFILSLVVVNLVIADSSTSYTIDVSNLNNGGALHTSSSYKMNSTIVGFVDGYQGNSASYSLGSGLIYLEQWCGNSILEFGETCDDGNTTGGDGCSATCQLENVCGNGLIEAGEICDDGNTANGDGCSFICTVEVGYGCVGVPSACSPICGDGMIVGSEQCDDGNTANNDGCSSTCNTEVCGDGIRQSNEECDDGNTANNDGCSAVCTLEAAGGGGYGGSTTGGWNFCGNGIFNWGEECDDGNNISGDGCSAVCDLEEIPPEEELKPVAPEELIARTIKIKARPEKRVNPSQNWASQARVVFYNKNLQKTVLVAYVNMNSLGWGVFETDRLPSGAYNIALKGLSHLTKTLKNTTIDGENHTLDFTFGETFYLTAGDVHESKDDFVNGLDISATVNRLYGSSAHADLNRDGIVNGLDLSIVVSNLYKTGDQM